MKHSRPMYASVEWVLLKPCESAIEKGPLGESETYNSFEIRGPFSTDDLLSKITSGEVSYSDYVWKSGHTAWLRIGQLPDFDRTRHSPNTGTLRVHSEGDFIPVPAQDELLGSVMRMNRMGARHSEEAPPEEAAGEDLVAPLIGNGAKRLLSIGILIVSAVFGAESFASQTIDFELPMEFLEGKSEAAPDASAGPKTPTAKSRAQKTTTLEIVPLKLSGATPLLVFQTDAGTTAPITVVVEGRSRSSPESPRISQTFTVQRTGGELPTLALEKLPSGSYKVTARAGGLQTEKDIILGVEEARLEAAFNSHQKELSLQQQSEKKALFYSASSFDRLAAELSKSYHELRTSKKQWSRFLSQWRKKAAAERANFTEEIKHDGKGFAYGVEIERFLAAADELLSHATELDKAIAQDRKPASAAQEKLSFLKFKKAAAQLSAF